MSTEEPKRTLLASGEDFENYVNTLLGILVESTRSCQTLSNVDFAYTAATNPGLKRRLDHIGDRIRGYINTVLQYQQPDTYPFINDVDDAQDKFDRVVDLLDNTLERVDTCLDECNGKVPAPSTLLQTSVTVTTVKSKKLDYRLIHAQNVPRPQLAFRDTIDNLNSIFVPKLTSKPNAIVPLTPSSDFSLPFLPLTGHGAMPTALAATLKSLPNPYHHEIATAVWPAWLSKPSQETLYAPMETSKCTWIATEEQLIALCDTLSQESVIAIDLEQHGYRSFQGFVCLMQVSTRTEDYLIDTLVLRHAMPLLNAIFTDPSIVKVLHGADSDILWLQRDFGLYIVNLFDTGQAARLLQYPSYSLAYLLHFHCQVTADKRYQLADWRIRPLPDEMAYYARQDTHYLLYIFDRLRHALLAQSLMDAAQRRSKEIALRVYEKEIVTETSYQSLVKKYHLFRWLPAQLSVLKTLYEWRDKIAREEDESPRYVLPNHLLLLIAEQMPTDANALLQCSHPTPPPLLRLHATDLARMIIVAKETPVMLVVEDIPTVYSEEIPAKEVAEAIAAVHHSVTSGELFIEKEKRDLDPVQLPERTVQRVMRGERSSVLSLSSSTLGFFGRVRAALKAAPQETRDASPIAKDSSTAIAARIYASLQSQPLTDRSLKVAPSPTIASRVLTRETAPSVAPSSTAPTGAVEETITLASVGKEREREAWDAVFGSATLDDVPDKREALQERLSKRAKKRASISETVTEKKTEKTIHSKTIHSKTVPDSKTVLDSKTFVAKHATSKQHATDIPPAAPERRLTTQPRSGDRSMMFTTTRR